MLHILCFCTVISQERGALFKKKKSKAEGPIDGFLQTDTHEITSRQEQHR